MCHSRAVADILTDTSDSACPVHLIPRGGVGPAEHINGIVCSGLEKNTSPIVESLWPPIRCRKVHEKANLQTS